MVDHGDYLFDYHTLFPADLGVHLLVGQEKAGHTYDGNFLGLALPIPDTFLEIAPGGTQKDPVEPARGPGIQPQVTD